MNTKFLNDLLTWACFALSLLTAYAVRVDIVTWEESIWLWGISIVGVFFVCISERKG